MPAKDHQHHTGMSDRRRKETVRLSAEMLLTTVRMTNTETAGGNGVAKRWGNRNPNVVHSGRDPESLPQFTRKSLRMTSVKRRK